MHRFTWTLNVIKINVSRYLTQRFRREHDGSPPHDSLQRVRISQSPRTRRDSTPTNSVLSYFKYDFKSTKLILSQIREIARTDLDGQEHVRRSQWKRGPIRPHQRFYITLWTMPSTCFGVTHHVPVPIGESAGNLIYSNETLVTKENIR